MMTTMAIQAEERAFLVVEKAAAEVLRRLQAALLHLIQSTPGPKQRPKDLQHALGVPYKLAWQVHSLAHAEDPIAQAGNMPGRAAMARFIEASSRRGAPIDAVAAVREALGRYEELVEVHASGSRSEFDSIISALSEEGPTQADLSHRRSMFRGQSHVLGIQADTHMACYIFHPARSGESMLDFIGLRGLVGLQRYRRDVGWVVSTMRALDDDGVVRESTGPEPLDPQGDPLGVGVLRQFCSAPLPELRQVPGRNGAIDVELQPDGLGASSAITCVVGHVYRNVFGRYRTKYNRHLTSQVRVRTPCKALVQDTLVHRDLVADAPPRGMVYSDHRDVDPAPAGRERDLLSARETVMHLGSGPEVMATLEVPQYPEMARHALECVGWKPEEFEVFRLRIEYPVMPSSVLMQFDLPDVL